VAKYGEDHMLTAKLAEDPEWLKSVKSLSIVGNKDLLLCFNALMER
jgi:hypothetical protein